MFDRETRAAAQGNLRGLATRSPAAGGRQRCARGAAPAAARRRPGGAHAARPGHRLERLRRRARRRRAHRRARRGDPGAAVRGPRHDVRRAARRRAPVPAGRARGRAARARRRGPRLPPPATVPRPRRGAVPRAAPGRPRPARGADDIAGAVTAGTPTLRRTPPFNDRLASLLDEVRAWPRTRRRGWACDGSRRPPTRCARRSTSSLPPRPGATTSRCCSATPPRLLSEGDDNGTWQRFIIIPTPQGPNNEGSPASAPANGPTAANHLHTNPYPNTAAPGQPVECEAGNEPFLLGPHGPHRPAGRAERDDGGHGMRGRRRAARPRVTRRAGLPRRAAPAAATSASRRTSRSAAGSR